MRSEPRNPHDPVNADVDSYCWSNDGWECAAEGRCGGAARRAGGMSAPRVIPVGERFGRLTVVVPRLAGAPRVECVCDCGQAHDVSFNEWGRTMSCGCLRREVASRKAATHRRTGTPEYRSWCHMRARCSDQGDADWPAYGGRGITVCDRWQHSFEAFFADMGERPAPRHSIDRIDNDGDYEPGNCRWATPKEQANNRRRPTPKPSCANGHEFTTENTYWYRGYRCCRECKRRSEAKRRARKVAMA